MRDATRLRFVLCALALSGLLLSFVVQLSRGFDFQSDLLALLPDEARDEAVRGIQEEIAARGARRVSVLVGAPDADTAQSAAQRFAQELRASGVFESVDDRIRTTPVDIAREYLPYRAGLLSERHRRLLERGDLAAVHDQAVGSMHSFQSMLRPLPFAEDPLGLLSEFLVAGVGIRGATGFRQGMVTIEDRDRHWVLVQARLRGSAFSMETQRAMSAALSSATDALARRVPQSRTIAWGVALHAAAAARQAQREMSLFGSLSTFAVVLLIVATFRSMRPLLLSVASLGLGVVAGLTACQWIFGRVHLITLVFGTTLIGVAVDYALHFFSDQFRSPGPWNGRQALRHVGPSILIGHLAAVAGYATLLLAPLPGVRQMAVFSVVGLATACACVLCLFPLLAHDNGVREPWALRWARRLGRSPLHFRRNRLHIAAAAVLVAVAAGGIMRLDPVDDVRILHAPPADLVDAEREAHRLLGTALDSRFLIVRGADAEQVLQREEALRDRLAPLLADGDLGDVIGVTRGLPSRARQEADRRLQEHTIHGQNGLAVRLLSELGADPATVRRHATLDAAAPILDVSTWKTMAASESLRALWFDDVGGGPATVVMLDSVRDVERLRSAVVEAEGVVLVDRVADVSALLRDHRVTTSLGVLAVYALIYFALVFRYGPRDALVILLPPAGAALLTLGMLGWIGSPLTLFNLLALLLVLGMGVDYAIFLREGRRAQPTVLLAIGLSAFTTWISFGLLSLSATPFVRSMGLTLAAGIALVFLLAVWLGPRGIEEAS